MVNYVLILGFLLLNTTLLRVLIFCPKLLISDSINIADKGYFDLLMSYVEVSSLEVLQILAITDEMI